jgi:branched-chain amino acid transport system permease protein
LAFGIGCGLAGIAGVLVASVFFVSASMGASVILKAFIIIILGGLGSVTGCLLGSLVLAFMDSYGGAFLPVPVVEFMTYMMIFTLLLFRPQGLLGHE